MYGEAVTLCLLGVVLAAAVWRPHGVPDVAVAVPAALLLLVTGVVSSSDVGSELHRLFPILVFLAAVLVLAQLCEAEGVFRAAGHWLARSSRGDPARLLVCVFVLASATTCVLSLDATVVLLTPVVLGTAARLEISARPHVYATGHLANSASLLLPMANLTNLLALAASGLTLVHFAAVMALPFVVVVIVEYVVLRVYFRRDLVTGSGSSTNEDVQVPWFAVGVLVATLTGFVVTSFVGVQPYWVAVIGAAVLAVHAWGQGVMGAAGIVRAADPAFLAFVFALAVVVRGVVDHGLGDVADRLLPQTTGLVALLAIAGIAAVLANVVNNLPALLILVAPAAALGPVAVLAVLIGVNIGPNLTYTGSLATLLWRRVLRDRGIAPSLARFTVLGVLTVPVNVVVAVVALWASARLLPFV